VRTNWLVIPVARHYNKPEPAIVSFAALPLRLRGFQAATNTMLKRLTACALVLICASNLAACGQKGPLTLPASAGANAAASHLA
jgi:predicted small lipoprotein YifL